MVIATQERVQTAQHCLAKHYLEHLRTATWAYQQGGESETYALALFDRERDQIMQSQAWAAAHADQDATAAALCNAFPLAALELLKLRLDLNEYQAWLDAAVRVAQRTGDRWAEATHLLNLVEFCGIHTDLEQALHWVQRALELGRQRDDRLLEARSHYLLGFVAERQGDYSSARTVLEQSRVLYQRLGDQRGQADVLQQLGAACEHAHDQRQAHEYMMECLAIQRELGNDRRMAEVLNDLGVIALSAGQHAEAYDFLEQSLAVARLLGDKEHEAFVLANLGSVALDQGDVARACRYAEQSAAAARPLGYLYDLSVALRVLSLALVFQGDLGAARACTEEGLALRRALNIKRYDALFLAHLAIISLRLHDMERARMYLREALDSAAAGPAPDTDWPLLYVVCMAALLICAQGDPAQAAVWLGAVESAPYFAVQKIPRFGMRQVRRQAEAALPPQRFVAAWEQGKMLTLDEVLAEVRRALDA